jgi:hypothetical protein
MYIKLYEQWLNENQVPNMGFTKIISKYMDMNYNNILDLSLNDLSQYGAFSNEIREAIKKNKAKYSDNLWNNLNTPSGVENAINVFKMMFNTMLGRKEPSSYRSKFEEAMFDAIGNERLVYNFGEKILKSKKVVDLMNSIVKGNKAYADEIGFYFAMFDVACAITNGIYYVSNQIPISMKYNLRDDGVKFNNLREAFDYKGNKFIDFEDIAYRAEGLFQKSVQSSRVGYMTPGQGRTIAYSVPITDYYLQIDTFKDYVNNFSLSKIQEESQKWLDDTSNSYRSIPSYIFGILYIGSYYNKIGKSIIERSTSFMQEGGASWYQKLLG